MSTCKGYAAAKPKAPLGRYSFERREPREHDVVIDIKYCGICHSDIHQARDEWSEYQEEVIFPMVPGHEIAGIVTAVGSKVSKYKVGDKVGVGCYVDSCRTCPECKAGMEQYCSVQTVWTYNGRDQQGAPTYGGYSERIVADENYVLRMPGNLPLEQCAPLLCAGITSTRRCVTGKPGRGRKSPSSVWADSATWVSSWHTPWSRRSQCSASP
jgi:uncharacterized zinc-type alcohol dehydrogenase-like protein